MVKLIRLVSDSDGNFRSSFGTDLTIKEQAKIALLNITFKTSVENLVINNTTGAIETNTDDPKALGVGQGQITPKEYNSVNIDELAEDVEFALNGSLIIPITPGLQTNNISSQYNVYLEDNKYNIIYKYSPFCNPLVFNDQFETEPFYPSQLIVKGTTTIDSTNTTIDDQTITTIQKAVGAPSANDTFARYVCEEGFSFSQGSGIITLRINDSLDNGSGVEDNGGVLGLTDAQLTNDDGTIVPGTDMKVQLIYNRPTENYFYSINGGTPKDTGILPSRVSLNVEPDDLLHDIMWIKRTSNYITFGVWQMVGGYLNLPSGNTWGNGTPFVTEDFDEVDLGDIATYRQVQNASGTPQYNWWEATDGYMWNVYSSKPVLPAGTTPIWFRARTNLETGVVTAFSGGTGVVNYTPAQMPTMVGTAVATENRFDDFKAVQGSVYRPFMIVRGASTNIKFDLFNFSVNPYIGKAQPSDENELWNITNVGGDSALDNGYRDILTGGIGTLVDVVTYIDDIDVDIGGNVSYSRWNRDLDTQITLHNSIWHGLGFNQVGMPLTFSTLTGEIGDLTPRYTSVIEAESIANFLLSDNFMVVSDTLKLDSFDASDFQYGKFTPNSRVKGDMAGRRKNILMTIPVNDNATGVVEFQTNTPIFIDINNAQIQNLKNLNFRILDKDFQPLNLKSENAIMTILIED